MEATREQTATALMSLGYTILRSWHFAARDERTPSAFINTNGHIHDYGSGFHGDFPAFLKEYHNFHNIGDALREAKRLLGLDISYSFSDFSKSTGEKKEGFIDEKWLKQYANHRKSHFEDYAKLLAALLPAVSSATKRREIALKYGIGYQPSGEFKGKTFPERLIMPVRDEANRTVTLWKYNPNLEKQNRLRYTQNRKRIAFNLSDLLKFREAPNELIFICEGEKDVLNAVANGVRAITPGSAVSLFEEHHLNLFKGLKIMVVGDYDEAGKKFNEAISKQLAPFAKSVGILDWESFMSKKGMSKHLKKGFDLTDWLVLKNANQSLCA